MTLRVVVVAVGAVAAALSPETALAQCAMCRLALQSPEGQQMIAALRSGILVLLAAPFLSFGVVAILAVRMRRRARGQGAAPAPEAPAEPASGRDPLAES
jgi:hypothetical protein